MMLSPQTKLVQEFNVYNRALHVYSEAERVHEAAALVSTDPAAAQVSGNKNTSRNGCCICTFNILHSTF